MHGEPIGFALFFQSYSTWRGQPGIYLEDLYVPERLRRNGIGISVESCRAWQGALSLRRCWMQIILATWETACALCASVHVEGSERHPAIFVNIPTGELA